MDIYLKEQIIVGFELFGVLIGLIAFLTFAFGYHTIIDRALHSPKKKTRLIYKILTIIGVVYTMIPGLLEFFLDSFEPGTICLTFFLLLFSLGFPMDGISQWDEDRQKNKCTTIKDTSDKLFRILSRVSYFYFAFVALGFILSLLYYPWYYFCGGFLLFEDQSLGNIIVDFIMSIIALLYVLATFVLIFKR